MEQGTARAVVVWPQDATQANSPQGQMLTPLLHRGTAPVSGISAGSVVMPAGHWSRAHVHDRSEITVVVLEGWAVTLCGVDMEPFVHGPGSVIWVPAGVPHAAVNLSEDHRVVALEHRTDPEFNADVRLLSELDALVARRVPEVRAEYVTRLDRAWRADR